MSFLEWRRFTFFNLKKNVDNGKIKSALGSTKVTATSTGHGTIVLCDSEGVIHLLNRNFHITTFQGYFHTVSLAAQPKTLPVLVTVGEDEEGGNPQIKIWDLEKKDRHGNPVCLKTIRITPNTTHAVHASAIAISDCANMMAVGFVDGAILLYRGNLTKDRGTKQKLIRGESDEVTGLAFKTSSKRSHLFVATKLSILQYNVTAKDREEEVLLDTDGCALQCSVLADTTQDCPFMVARNDAIYCYTTDGRGPCYAVDGPKVCLQWFRSYLIIVAKSTLQFPVTVSSTNSDDSSNSDKGQYMVTVLDVQNKIIVFSTALEEVVTVLSEWGSFYILTKDYRLHDFIEKDLQSKLSLLFRKNLYDISIRMAKNQQYDSDSMAELFRQYGDHLYSKGDHNGSIDPYIKTIGKLEPSYVIRKFLDSQHIDNLIKYLSALHKQGVATGDHTTLLLNCYTKLNNIHELKEFILTKDRDIDFDINIAISVCRKSCSEDALILAEKHGLHLWYIKILLEDHHSYLAALQYMAKLQFTDAYEMVIKFGDTLILHAPNEFTEFLKKLCTNYYPSNIPLPDQDEREVIRADPQDFIHLLLNNSAKMVDFLEHLTQFSNKWDISVYNTLIEHYLHLWYNSSDLVKRQCEQKLLTTLQSSEIKYDKNQALILCTMRNFKPGILHLLEENKLFKQILWYQLNSGNYNDVLACCRKFGYQESSLWVKALWSAVNDNFFPPNILCEILAVIEKEHLLSPLQVIEVISRSKSLTVGDVRNYFLSILKTESKIIDEENESINKYKQETERIRQHIEKIRNSPMLFQSSVCSVCKAQLDLPSVHFLCQHSFHQHCYQSYVENEAECPVCIPNNQKILGVIKSQAHSRDLHETFHGQIERAEDSFSLIADYFGRNIFTKPTVNLEIAKQLQNSLKTSLKNMEKESTPTHRIIKVPKEVVQTNERKNKTAENNLLTLNSSIYQSVYPRAESPITNDNLLSNDSLMNAVENKRNIPSTNPFDDYDEKNNPFFEEDGSDRSDDYDNSLNPFA